MAIISKIQWTDATYNPWHGCKKVSEGCKFCYMYRDKERYKADPTLVLRSKTKFYDPLSWKEPRLVFTCSWSDFFIEEADPWRAEVWEIIKATPHLTYQILTKRPERIKECLPEDWGQGYPNVWLGVSVENQKATGRMITLLDIPAAVRFISAEPLLGPLDLGAVKKYFALLDTEFYVLPAFDWVIVGGESGNEVGKYQYRPAELAWFESIIHVCKANNVPVFFKQTGTHLAKELKLVDRHGGWFDELPPTLQIREFPKQYKPANNE